MLGLRGYACTCQNYLDNYRCIRDRKAQCMQPQNVMSYSDLDMSILPLPSSRCKHGDCFEKSLPTSHPLPLHQSWVLPYLYHGWPSLTPIRLDSRMHDCLFRQKYSFSICNNRLTKLSTRFFFTLLEKGFQFVVKTFDKHVYTWICMRKITMTRCSFFCTTEMARLQIMYKCWAQDTILIYERIQQIGENIGIFRFQHLN